jgi:HPt (histidine-containing phosphotransfer) domain-containing protein
MTHNRTWQIRRAEQELDRDVFDLEHLRRYTLDDPALECELLNLFLSQAEAARSQLALAVDAADWKLAAHSLKGSALAVGAVAIANLSARIEDQGLIAGGARQTMLAELDEAITIFRVAARSIGR